MNTEIDIDVASLATWGVLFQDCPTTFSGRFGPRDGGGKGNVWNYIDAFGVTNPHSFVPENRYGGGDTPIFWTVWNETTIKSEGDPVYNCWEYLNDDWSPLADWERDLLGWNEHIGWQTMRAGDYSYDIWKLLAGN